MQNVLAQSWCIFPIFITCKCSMWCTFIQRHSLNHQDIYNEELLAQSINANKHSTVWLRLLYAAATQHKETRCDYWDLSQQGPAYEALLSASMQSKVPHFPQLSAAVQYVSATIYHNGYVLGCVCSGDRHMEWCVHCFCGACTAGCFSRL